MADARTHWSELLARAAALSTDVVEVSALSGEELPGLIDWWHGSGPPAFSYVAVHGPTKSVPWSEEQLVALLEELPEWVASIVLHPDTLGEATPFRRLGQRLVLENMDFRKLDGRTANEMARWFDQLPEAGFCLDVAHARSIDPSMGVAHELLDRFGDRLRQVHVSGLDESGHHVMVTHDDLAAYQSTLRRCEGVPIVLEAQPPSWLILKQL